MAYRFVTEENQFKRRPKSGLNCACSPNEKRVGRDYCFCEDHYI